MSKFQSLRPRVAELNRLESRLFLANVTMPAHGEFESECPGYCGAQDTFYVGIMKGVGRIYQQTFVDTYSKVTFAKLYDRKTPITAADLLNDRVVPFFDEKEVKLSRVLTDRGTEYCGNPAHEYELYLALEDIDHSRTKTKSPQTNEICERNDDRRRHTHDRETGRDTLFSHPILRASLSLNISFPKRRET